MEDVINVTKHLASGNKSSTFAIGSFILQLKTQNLSTIFNKQKSLKVAQMYGCMDDGVQSCLQVHPDDVDA